MKTVFKSLYYSRTNDSSQLALLPNAIRLAIANSIISGDSDIVKPDGKIVAQFTNGICVWIDSEHYEIIANTLRNMYSREEVRK